MPSCRLTCIAYKCACLTAIFSLNTAWKQESLKSYAIIIHICLWIRLISWSCTYYIQTAGWLGCCLWSCLCNFYDTECFLEWSHHQVHWTGAGCCFLINLPVKINSTKFCKKTFLFIGGGRNEISGTTPGGRWQPCQGSTCWYSISWHWTEAAAKTSDHITFGTQGKTLDISFDWIYSDFHNIEAAFNHLRIKDWVGYLISLWLCSSSPALWLIIIGRPDKCAVFKYAKRMAL